MFFIENCITDVAYTLRVLPESVTARRVSETVLFLRKTFVVEGEKFLRGR